jgi:hypothetical protein
MQLFLVNLNLHASENYISIIRSIIFKYICA